MVALIEGMEHGNRFLIRTKSFSLAALLWSAPMTDRTEVTSHDCGTWTDYHNNWYKKKMEHLLKTSK